MWRKIMKRVSLEEWIETLKMIIIPELLSELFTEMKQHPEDLTNGFAKDGLDLLNKMVISKSKIVLLKTMALPADDTCQGNMQALEPLL